MSRPDLPPSSDHGLPTSAVGSDMPGSFCWHDWGFSWNEAACAYRCKACGLLIRPETWLKWNPQMQFPEE